MLNIKLPELNTVKDAIPVLPGDTAFRIQEMNGRLVIVKAFVTGIYMSYGCNFKAIDGVGPITVEPPYYLVDRIDAPIRYEWTVTLRIYPVSDNFLQDVKGFKDVEFEKTIHPYDYEMSVDDFNSEFCRSITTAKIILRQMLSRQNVPQPDPYVE